MSVPNIGPELPDPSDGHAQDHARRGNPSLVYRDDLPAGDIAAASARASLITQRFGGVHYALSRPGLPFTAEAPVFETFHAEPPVERRPLFDFRLAWPWQPRLELPVEDPEATGGESDPHD